MSRIPDTGKALQLWRFSTEVRGIRKGQNGSKERKKTLFANSPNWFPQALASRTIPVHVLKQPKNSPKVGAVLQTISEL
jgi:hypothetical protein